MHERAKASQSPRWDKSIPAEANSYYWTGDPIVRHAPEQSYKGPVVAELFSGLGGLSQGFVQAGFALALVADIHRPSIESMTANHPNTTSILGDLKYVSSRMLLDALDGVEPDVLMAGVPCQGFSRSNRKRSDDDERNQLFREFLRLAGSVNPRAILIENVSGMRSARGGDFVREIASAIDSQLNMDVHLAFLNAAHYGVPQTRERLFFVGLPRRSPWSEPERAFGPGTNRRLRTVRDAIEDLPELRAGESSAAYGREPASDYARALRASQSELLNHRAPAHPEETIRRIQSTPPGEPMYPNFRQRIRLDWDEPSPTQVSGGIRAQFQFGHPSQARGLTIRERCRIQSFPDHIVVQGGLVQGRVQTGNAVPPLLAQAMAQAIRQSLGK